MQHWEKTKELFYQHSAQNISYAVQAQWLINISITLPTLCRIKLNEHRNPSKMLLETCTTQSFKYSIYIYIYTEYTMETFRKHFLQKHRNVPK